MGDTFLSTGPSQGHHDALPVESNQGSVTFQSLAQCSTTKLGLSSVVAMLAQYLV